MNFSKLTDELCFGQDWGLLEQVGIWRYLEFSNIGTSSWYLLTETIPAATLLPKSCHVNIHLKIQQVPVGKKSTTCIRNNKLNFLCYLAKWLVCLVGRVGGSQALNYASSRRCPGHRLCKCQAGPGQQQIEVSDRSGAGGNLLVCEGLGVKSLIFCKRSSVTLASLSCPPGL